MLKTKIPFEKLLRSQPTTVQGLDGLTAKPQVVDQQVLFLQFGYDSSRNIHL